MTTGLKTPSNYYIELITSFPPRPITNDAELIATQNRINSILERRTITQDDRDYLNVLGTLVYDYEEKHEPVSVLKGIEFLKVLLVEDNVQLKDLNSIFPNESFLLEILNGDKELTVNQIQKLSKFFHVAPARFLD